MKDLDLSFFDRRNIDSDIGPYVKRIYGVDSNLHAVMSDDTDIDLGNILPKPARSVTLTELREDGVLQVTFDNGDVVDLGYMADIIEVVRPTYYDDGIFSPSVQDFKPLQLPAHLGSVSTTDTEVVITANDIDQSIVTDLSPDALESQILIYSITSDVTDTHKNIASVVGDNLLEWDGVTDGVITLPVGNTELVTEIFHYSNSGNRKVVIIDVDTGEEIYETPSRETPSALGSKAKIRYMSYQSEPRNIKLVLRVEQSHISGLWRGPVEAGVPKILRRCTIIRNSLVDYTPGEVEPVKLGEELRAFQEWVASNNITDVDYYVNWLTEGVGNSVWGSYFINDILYVVTRKTSVLAYDTVTKKTVPILLPVVDYTGYAACTDTDLVVFTSVGIYTYRDGKLLRYVPFSNLIRSGTLSPNAEEILYFTNVGQDKLITRQSLLTGEVILSTDVDELGNRNSLAYLPNIEPELVEVSKAGWVLKYTDMTILLAPEATVPTVLDHPSSNLQASVTGKDIMTLPRRELVTELYESNFTDFSNGQFTFSTDVPLCSNRYIWNAARNPSYHNSGWLSNVMPSVATPYTVNIKSDIGPFACNCIYIDQDRQYNSNLRVFDVLGKRIDGEWVTLYQYIDYSTSNKYLHFNDPDFIGTEIKIIIYDAVSPKGWHIGISNIKLMMVNQLGHRSLIPDLRAGPVGGFSVSGPSTPGRPVSLLTHRSGILEEMWEGPSDANGEVEIIYELGKEYLVTGYEIGGNLGNVNKPNDINMYLWIDGEWVLENYRGINLHASYVKSGYTFSGTYTSRVRFVLKNNTPESMITTGMLKVLTSNADELKEDVRYTKSLSDLPPYTTPHVYTRPYSTISSNPRNNDALTFKLTSNSTRHTEAFKMFKMGNSNPGWSEGFLATVRGDITVENPLEIIFDFEERDLVFDTWRFQNMRVAQYPMYDFYLSIDTGDGEWTVVDEHVDFPRIDGNVGPRILHLANGVVKARRVKLTVTKAAGTQTWLYNFDMYVSELNSVALDLPEGVPVVKKEQWTTDSYKYGVETTLQQPLYSLNDNTLANTHREIYDVETNRLVKSQFELPNLPYETTLGKGGITYTSRTLVDSTWIMTDKITEITDIKTRSERFGLSGWVNKKSGLIGAVYSVWRTSDGYHWLSDCTNRNSILRYDEVTDQLEPITLDSGRTAPIKEIVGLEDNTLFVFRADNANVYDKSTPGKVPYTRSVLDKLETDVTYYSIEDRDAYLNFKMLNGTMSNGDTGCLFSNRLNGQWVEPSKLDNEILIKFTVPYAPEAIYIESYHVMQYIPDEIKLWSSVDGKDWTLVKDLVYTKEVYSKTIDTLEIAVAVKYFKLTTTTSTPYTGLTNISFLSTTEKDTTYQDYFWEKQTHDLDSVSRSTWYNYDIVSHETSEYLPGFTGSNLLNPWKTNRPDETLRSNSEPLVVTMTNSKPTKLVKLKVWNGKDAITTRVKLEGYNGTIWEDIGTFSSVGSVSYDIGIDSEITTEQSYLKYRLTTLESSNPELWELYRVALVTDEDILTKNELLTTRPESTDLYFQNKVVTPKDGTYLYANGKVGYILHILSDGSSEWISLEDIRKQVSDLSLQTNACWDHVNERLIIGASPSHMGYIYYQNGIWGEGRVSIANFHAGLMLPAIDGSIMNNYSGVRTLDLETNVLELLEPIREDGTTVLPNFRNGSLLPTGENILTDRDNQPAVILNIEKLTIREPIPIVSSSTTMGNVTMTAKGEILVWPNYASYVSQLQAVKIVYKGVTPPPPEILNSYLLR